MSGVILAIGAIGLGAKGLNFGIDFESGTRITTALERPATENQVRDVLAANGAPDAEVQRVDDPELGDNVFQISTEELQPTAGAAGARAPSTTPTGSGTTSPTTRSARRSARAWRTAP